MKQSLHYSLMKSHMALRSTIIHSCNDCISLVGSPTRVVEYLYVYDGNTPRNIALHCEVPLEKIDEVLQRMEQEELIERRQGTNGELIFLSDEGRFTGAWLDKILDEADEMAAYGMTEAEQGELIRLLDKVYNNVRRSQMYPNE